MTELDADRRKILLAGTTLAIASAIAGATTQDAGAAESSLNPQPLPPSPGWERAMPPAPDARVKITEEYARHVGRDAYFWAWPMVNMYNRRLHFMQVKEAIRQGPLMESPVNRLVMLTDYVDPDERSVACPNQDVVYGFGLIDANRGPSVIQVPDFGGRFWVYQAVDQRTDSFVRLGAMYDTKPGMYLLAPKAWTGDVPPGIQDVFRFDTRIAIVAPRVFMDDTDEDRATIQPLLRQVMMYPLDEFTGELRTKDWANAPVFPAGDATQGDHETQWVVPEQFFDLLGEVLDNVPSRPGEEALYDQMRTLLEAAANELFDVVGSGAVKVSINQTFALKDAADAHRALEGRRTTGSTIMLP